MTKRIYISDEDKMMRDKSLKWSKPSVLKNKAYKVLSKRLKKDFSGIKTKNLGDGMMEISIK